MMTAKKSTKTAAKKTAAKKTAAKKTAAKKTAAKKTRGNRWRPASKGALIRNGGPTIKSNVFALWLKDPVGADAETIHKLNWAKDVSLSTIRKWLSGFASGRDGTGDSNYPRQAAGQLKQIEAALKKLGAGAKIDPNERKRLEALL